MMRRREDFDGEAVHHNLRVRLTPTQYTRLCEIARREDRTAVSLARVAIRTFLDDIEEAHSVAEGIR